MKRYLLLIISLLTMLAGCVAYPVTRTYYEPNPNDGDLTATSGCGYHTTKNDSLERIIDGVTIHVMPEYVDGENLKVTISIKKMNLNISTFIPEKSLLKMFPVEINCIRAIPL